MIRSILPVFFILVPPVIFRARKFRDNGVYGLRGCGKGLHRAEAHTFFAAYACFLINDGEPVAFLADCVYGTHIYRGTAVVLRAFLFIYNNIHTISPLFFPHLLLQKYHNSFKG